MLSPSHSGFLIGQNFWIKCIIFILGSITTLVIPMNALIIQMVGTSLYLFLFPSFLKHFIKGFRIFLPFLATYSLFATLVGVSYPDMIIFLARMLNLIILMVYFSVSLKLTRVLEDCSFLLGKPYLRPLAFFVIATLLYIKTFIAYYRSNITLGKAKFFNFQKLISGLLSAVAENWKDKDIIEAKTTILLNSQFDTPHFLTRWNILGCLYITFLVLILSL